MSGNTRGKLKEHFEGIHRNLDWCMHHIQHSLGLIAAQFAFTDEMIAAKDSPEKQEEILMQVPMYKAVVGIGEGIQTLDELANDIYSKF